MADDDRYRDYRGIHNAGVGGHGLSAGNPNRFLNHTSHPAHRQQLQQHQHHAHHAGHHRGHGSSFNQHHFNVGMNAGPGPGPHSAHQHHPPMQHHHHRSLAMMAQNANNNQRNPMNSGADNVQGSGVPVGHQSLNSIMNMMSPSNNNGAGPGHNSGGHKGIGGSNTTPVGGQGGMAFFGHAGRSPHSRMQGSNTASFLPSGNRMNNMSNNPEMNGMRFVHAQQQKQQQQQHPSSTPHHGGHSLPSQHRPHAHTPQHHAHTPYGTSTGGVTKLQPQNNPNMSVGYARSPVAASSPDDISIQKRAANLHVAQQLNAAYFRGVGGVGNIGRTVRQPPTPQHATQHPTQHSSLATTPTNKFKYPQDLASMHESSPMGRSGQGLVGPNGATRSPMLKGPTSPYTPMMNSHQSLTAPKMSPSAMSGGTPMSSGNDGLPLSTIMAAEKEEQSPFRGMLNGEIPSLSPSNKGVTEGEEENSNKLAVLSNSKMAISETYSKLMKEALDVKEPKKKKKSKQKDEENEDEDGKAEDKKGKGKGKGRGKSKKAPKITSLTAAGPNGTIIPIKGPDGEPLIPNDEVTGLPPVWYAGCVPLGVDEDQFWLSELQVYLRANFAEAFGATDKDIDAPMHGRNKPIALGQVGIRCIWCRDEPPNERGQQAVSYPSLVSGIYNSVQQMFRLHFDCCTSMPGETRKKIETLRASSSSRGGRKQYWIDSAKRLGLVDTPHGIHFGRDPTGPLPPLAGPSAALMTNSKSKESTPRPNKKAKLNPDLDQKLLSKEHAEEINRQKEEAYPLVEPEDKPLISDYLYLTLQQMEPCRLMDADRVGCYKGREMGFPGLACKWCVGQAGCGRYFPASEASLSQTTTSQTILNHVRNCRRCPVEIRDDLELMKRSKVGPDGKKSEKPKHGGRKVFFHRLWCRIQGLPIDELENVEVKIGRQKGAKNKYSVEKSRSRRKRGRKKRDAEEETDSSDDEEGMSDEDDSEEEDDNSEDEDFDQEEGEKKGSPKLVDESEEESIVSEFEEDDWVAGCCHLNKSDDIHFLSESQCFVRSEMIEAFSVTSEDITTEAYDDVEEGQVGIRCKFCGRLDPEDRPAGHVYFPKSVSAIYQCVMDLQRRHYIACDELPEDLRKSFKSLKAYGAKAEGETHKYWVDAARELGLKDSNDGRKVFFFRDPKSLSPADEMVEERDHAAFDKNSLVRPGDEDIATDLMLLLLHQVKPCRFKTSDRRVGTSSRKDRDRVLGFPGIESIHPTKKNAGRYFPVNSKAFGDNTMHSLQTSIMNSSRCPQELKASLTFLSHRAALQKWNLGGSWKQKYFKLVWDRLHVQRAWAKRGNDIEVIHHSAHANRKDDASGDKQESGGESDTEAMNEMGGLIKAAAIWLCERDADTEALQSVRTTRGAKRKSSVASRRELPSRYSKEKNNGGTSGKRSRRRLL